MTDLTKPKPKYKKATKTGRLVNPKTPVNERPADYKGVGAPSKYRPEMCEKVVELGKLGKSYAQIAAELGIDRDTLSDWILHNAEFSLAMKKSRVNSQKWWEDIAQANLIMEPGTGTFSAAVWAKSMSARFQEDYTEKKQLEVTGRVSLLAAIEQVDATE